MPLWLISLGLKAAGIGKVVGGFLLAHWRETLIAVLALALLMQHGCLTKAQHALSAEKAAHAADNKLCKENDERARKALAASNASVEALRRQAVEDTARAQKAVDAAHAAAQRASSTAAQVMARKQVAGGVCPSIHALRMEMSR